MSTTSDPGAAGLRFDGRVALVTGGGRGLGRAYAEALAARGAQVVVNDLPPEAAGSSPAEEVVEAIQARGGSALVSHHDVTSEAEAAQAVETAVDVYGRIDVVVNNAGGGSAGLFVEQSSQAFAAVIESHLFGSVNITRAAWPHLLRQRYGRVVMTTSAVGLWGAPGSAAYAAAKAGLVGLAQVLALEGASEGVLVNCIAPAAQTRMSASRFPKPGSRTWRPELVAPAALYLSHESCEVTGTTISAFAGLFAKVEIVQGTGVRWDARGEVELEDFVARLDDICSMVGARKFANGHLDALGSPLAVDLESVVKRLAVDPTMPGGSDFASTGG